MQAHLAVYLDRRRLRRLVEDLRLTPNAPLLLLNLQHPQQPGSMCVLPTAKLDAPKGVSQCLFYYFLDVHLPRTIVLSILTDQLRSTEIRCICHLCLQNSED